MIDTAVFLGALKKHNMLFFTGVPDSLLANFCECIDNDRSIKNIICANEGAAIALAAGHYLSTKNIGVVYMQNSGIGNAVNPLLSLADKEVYGIPILLIIGWRGEPGIKDEPQHIKQGKVTDKLLEAMGIPYKIISDTSFDFEEIIAAAYQSILENSEPYALLIRENTFEQYKQKKSKESKYLLERENAIKIIIENIEKDAAVVSTTGKISRELFELREQLHQSHSSDFLTVGSMGHASQIALGIALSIPSKKIYCLDGDGAAIMHMGSMGLIGTSSCLNYKHIIINNGAHDSVGGQPTFGFDIDFTVIAKACGYKTALTAENETELVNKIKMMKEIEGPALLEVKVKKGARKDLGRPTSTPVENKNNFMQFLKR
jgi:phosphonopyruvate decarboxylase